MGKSIDRLRIPMKVRSHGGSWLMLRWIASAIVSLSCLLPSGAAAQRAPAHQSIVSAALAGADLCWNVFMNVAAPSPRTLSQLYEASGWYAVEAAPAHFPYWDIGENFGIADLAPSVSGRVVSAVRLGAMGASPRCTVMLLSAPGARDLFLRELASSEVWTELQIDGIPNTRMFGRKTGSPVADIGLTIMWGATGEENRELEAFLNVSMIPPSSLIGGVWPPANE
jgi:hypothetical protein